MDSNIIEIDGIKYKKIEKEKPSKYLNKGYAMMIATMAMMGNMNYPCSLGGTENNENSKIDIVEEYKLILQKKSCLSKNQRDWVVWRFKRDYKQIE